ncbi:hypothetical protein GPECTOR_5g456 [Gonium pectorale]|uniref:Serine aminopeptidase S33 domain-containing protein n=1 Tax=Gonium pectorale TaxID=33097 RepID=A0A150GWW7_GONPE|nr:hypothetical protein GPECTOR_5g456 [Gonium pectorale]|eukprot:KXZ54377.1 hypothetical protein GPECTOR_5g456 [Gonium pectorale]
MGSCLSKSSVAPNQVAPEFDSETDYLGANGYKRPLKGKSGDDLCAYFWPADENVPLKGIVQLSHGSAAYTCFDFLKFQAPGQPNVYEGSWVASLNRAGFAVCGLDAAGYGRSKGPRTAVGRMQDHVDNLLLLADSLSDHGGAAFPPGRPYFLLGHSLGGLVATLAAVQQPNRFSGLVLLSPTLSLEHLSQGGKDAKAALTERPVPWIFEAWEKDPLVHDGGARSAAADDLLPSTEALCGEGGLEAVTSPLLIFQSSRDTHVEPDGAKKLHERATTTDKTLRWLDRQWHVLTKEEGWEELLEETVEWLAARALNHGALTRGVLSGTDEQPEAAQCASKELAPPAAEQEAEDQFPEGSPEGEAGLPGAAGEEAEASGEGDKGAEQEAEDADDGKAKAEEDGEGEGRDDADGAEDGKSNAGGEAAAPEAEPEPAGPVLTRSMSVLARSPDRVGAGGAAATGGLVGRGYSFSGKGGELSASAASGLSLLAPLPPLVPRRSLGTMPSELAAYGAFPARPLTARSRLPPLDSKMLLDKKPIA